MQQQKRIIINRHPDMMLVGIQVLRDWVFSEYEKVRTRGYFKQSEINARKAGTTLNIIEAAVTGNMAGFRDNALAGAAMAFNPPEDLRVVGETRFIEYELSKEWTSLYESWNLAFVLGNMTYFQNLLPKLLIPQVVNADPHDYLFNRALALWVSVNTHLFSSHPKSLKKQKSRE